MVGFQPFEILISNIFCYILSLFLCLFKIMVYDLWTFFYFLY